MAIFSAVFYAPISGILYPKTLSTQNRETKSTSELLEMPEELANIPHQTLKLKTKVCFWQCNFHLNPNVRLMVSWSVGQFFCLSLFPKSVTSYTSMPLSEYSPSIAYVTGFIFGSSLQLASSFTSSIYPSVTLKKEQRISTNFEFWTRFDLTPLHSGICGGGKRVIVRIWAKQVISNRCTNLSF